jgi:hypothetical protein
MELHVIVEVGMQMMMSDGWWEQHSEFMLHPAPCNRTNCYHNSSAVPLRAHAETLNLACGFCCRLIVLQGASSFDGWDSGYMSDNLGGDGGYYDDDDDEDSWSDILVGAGASSSQLPD